MMELTVQKRDVFGKKVKNLKKNGLIPAVLYGKDIKDNISLQFNKIEFIKMYRSISADKSLKLKGDINENVIIKDISVHPVSNELIHVDFIKA